MTSFPTWAAYALGFGTPVLSAATAFAGSYVGHRAARELEIRSKREEVMRSLRWAAELAVSDDAAKARLGVAELEELRDSKMLAPNLEGFVYAALRTAIEIPRKAIIQSVGEVEAVVRTDSDITGGNPVSSKEREQGEEAAS